MDNCIFCKIAKKDIPVEIVYENKDVVVFADIKRAAPKHYLIVSKRHIKSINHIKTKDSELITEIIFTAQKIAKKLKLKGYKLVFNVGREGGQTIDHLHLHLLGGWSNRVDMESINKTMASKAWQ